MKGKPVTNQEVQIMVANNFIHVQTFSCMGWDVKAGGCSPLIPLHVACRRTETPEAPLRQNAPFSYKLWRTFDAGTMENESFCFEEKRSRNISSFTAITPLTFTKVRLTAGNCFQSHWYSRSPLPNPPQPPNPNIRPSPVIAAHSWPNTSTHDWTLLRGEGGDKSYFWLDCCIYTIQLNKYLFFQCVCYWPLTSVVVPSAATIKDNFQCELQGRYDMEALCVVALLMKQLFKVQFLPMSGGRYWALDQRGWIIKHLS